MGYWPQKETNVLLDSLKIELYIFATWTADNGSEMNKDGEGVKNTVWL